MLESYRTHVAERAAQGIVPLPLIARQVRELCELLQSPPAGEGALLLELLTERVPPGVDGAAKVKAEFLNELAQGRLESVEKRSKQKRIESCNCSSLCRRGRAALPAR